MTPEQSQPDFEALYHRAFADFKLRALWNVRELEHPTAEEALIVTRSLRVERTGLPCHSLKFKPMSCGCSPLIETRKAMQAGQHP